MSGGLSGLAVLFFMGFVGNKKNIEYHQPYPLNKMLILYVLLKVLLI